ncbi:MAG: hypothetical protein ACR2M6_00425 [Vampirovibrionia bacterium]|jgi:hypothetical protein
MIKNLMYEKMIAIIYFDNNAIGWMSTTKEADMFCSRNNSYCWDNYYPHRHYVDLKQLTFMNVYSESE